MVRCGLVACFSYSIGAPSTCTVLYYPFLGTQKYLLLLKQARDDRTKTCNISIETPSHNGCVSNNPRTRFFLPSVALLTKHRVALVVGLLYNENSPGAVVSWGLAGVGAGEDVHIIHNTGRTSPRRRHTVQTEPS